MRARRGRYANIQANTTEPAIVHLWNWRSSARRVRAAKQQTSRGASHAYLRDDRSFPGKHGIKGSPGSGLLVLLGSIRGRVDHRLGVDAISEKGRAGVGVVENDAGTVQQIHPSRTGKGTEKVEREGRGKKGKRTAGTVN